MRRLHGFSLMEMMIVLTIVAIVAAASAPMVNKKMVRAASEKSPWVFVNGESIGYNIDNENGIQDRKTATIGANGRVPNAGGNPRLYIDTNLDTTPHILFGRSSGNLMRLIAGGAGRNLWFSNQNIPADITSSVVLGQGAVSSTSDATAIGANVNISGDESVAIGRSANTTSDASVAIGERAQAGQDGINDINRYAAIAIGSVSRATRTRSIAIGRHAEATNTGAIAMGSSGNDEEATRARAMGISSIAIGQSALAANNTSVALGGNAQTSGENSIAIGYDAQVGDNIVDQIISVNTDNEPHKIAIGSGAHARKENSIAIGHGATANPNFVSPLWEPVKKRAIAMGWEARAHNSDAIAIGNRFAGKRATASGIGAVALGTPAQATGNFSIAIGGSTNTTATVEGAASVVTTEATAEGAVAIGPEAQATALNAVAIGRGARATTPNTIVLGSENSTVVFPGSIQLGSATSTIYIPGNLVVDRNVYLNRLWNGNDNVQTYVGMRKKSGSGNGNALTSFSYRKVYDRNGVLQHNTELLPSNVPLPAGLSDRRLKNIGQEFKAGISELNKIKIFNYTFKDDTDKTPHVGVIAQDLQKIFPDAVMKGEDGFLRIRMEDMFYAVINAVKELDTRTTAQEKKIQELEKRIEELEKKIK